jgi:hypothetical protein
MPETIGAYLRGAKRHYVLCSVCVCVFCCNLAVFISEMYVYVMMCAHMHAYDSFQCVSYICKAYIHTHTYIRTYIHT